VDMEGDRVLPCVFVLVVDCVLLFGSEEVEDGVKELTEARIELVLRVQSVPIPGRRSRGGVLR
jgi:hypothetical protein